MKHECRSIIGDPSRHGAPNVTLFQQPWWLEAAAGADLERVRVVWDGLTVASLPFVRTRKWGIRCLGMPHYTRTLGPVLHLPESSPAQRRKNLRRVAQDIVRLLPQHDRFFQLLDPRDQSAFAFSLSGCAVQQHYTFQISADREIASVWDNIHSSKRRLIRAAEREFQIATDLTIDDLIPMLYKDRPRQTNTHRVDVLRRIYRACEERAQAAILGVRNQDGVAVAAVALVWDKVTAYYWIPARNRDLTSGKENCYLLWSAIQFAIERKLSFDFDGYLTQASAEFLSSFGADLAVRPAVTHTSLLGKIALLTNHAVKRPA